MPDETDPPENAEPAFNAVEAAAEFAAAMADNQPVAPDGEVPGGGTDRYTAMLEEEVESLKALLSEKDEALTSAQQKVATATAEVSRVRARLEANAAQTIEHKRRSILASFLEVADALDRAAEALASGDVAPEIAQGVAAVRSELKQVLGQHGATRRPSLGEAFDAAHHEAIATAPATAEAPAGTITAVLSEGYEIGDETLRAARVVVAKD